MMALRKWLLMLLLAMAGAAAASDTEPGKPIQDCPDCPTMIVVPAGTFMMGDDNSERPDERPAHQVTIPAFAVARTEITRAQYAVFARETGGGAGGTCLTDRNRDGRFETSDAVSWMDPGFPVTDAHPVTCLNWSDARAYAHWLSAKTGKRYRLLSEAEYEYALRGGTATRFFWGDDQDQMCRYANGHDESARKAFPRWTGGAACDDGHDVLAPVASYAPNGYGLYDLAGNAWEWTADCYVPDYKQQPRDGAAFDLPSCGWRATRGGSWVFGLPDLRSAQRNWKIRPDQRGADVGFRVARDL